MGFLRGLTDTLGDVVDAGKSLVGLPTRKDRDEQSRLISEQIKAYREQTAITREEAARKKNELATQKRRVEEKQIRALKRNTSRRGLLGESQSGQQDMSSKLGG